MDEIEEFRLTCLSKVRGHVHHELSWSDRINIWRVLNRLNPQDGLDKRKQMSYVVAKSLLPLWRAQSIPQDAKLTPETLVAFARQILLGHESEELAIAFLDQQQLDVEAAQFQARSIGTLNLVPATALRACWDALEDLPELDVWPLVVSGEVDETSVDEQDLDVHFLASTAYSGGVSGSSQDADLRRLNFWKHWLEVQLPFVLKNSVEVILGR